MNELKECFPDFAQSTAIASVQQNVTTVEFSKLTSPSTSSHEQMSNNTQLDESTKIGPTHSVTTLDDVESITNYTEHFLRKLGLPPVAQASVQCLVYFCRNRSVPSLKSSNEQQDHFSATKLPTLCGALSFFICVAGSTMQTLASQAITAEKQKKSGAVAAVRSMGHVPSWKSKFSISKQESSKPKTEETSTVASSSSSSFDIFNDIDSSRVDAEHRAYEMRRMWDAWIEQMPWKRSISEIEKSCGVSQKAIRDYYKQYLFPVREQLLSILREPTINRSGLASIGSSTITDTVLYPEQLVLGDTSLASLLLSHVTVAAPLMKSDVNL
jgi:hypothetical protein